VPDERESAELFPLAREQSRERILADCTVEFRYERVVALLCIADVAQPAHLLTSGLKGAEAALSRVGNLGL
jgi:hypothetical protein